MGELLDAAGNPTKPNGAAAIETRESWAEMKRTRRRATVGEVEAAFNQMAADLERFAHALLSRVERLEQLAGYVHRDTHREAQRSGTDLE